MCLRPVTINRRLQNYNSPSVLYRLSKVGLAPFAVDSVTVPCGHCVECLRRRQNDLAFRCMREAEKRGSMAFVTLTYNNQSLPLACNLERIDKDTGAVELIGSSPLVRYKGETKDLRLVSEGFVHSVRAGVLSLKCNSSPRYFYTSSPFDIDDGFSYRYCITPSLNRRDVRLWLKRCRVRYERLNGRSLPDFSYVVVGEMGPRTCRPHYHLGIFGLPISDVRWLASEWSYGFTNVKSVDAVNKDGSNGFQLASMYIGKYMVKGKFECESVRCKYAEKPRLMISRGLGSGLSENLINYYRCYDLFGEYDIDTCRLADGRFLSQSQLSALRVEVLKRSHFSFGGKNFPIPSCIIKKLWYVPSEKNNGSYRSSTVRTAFSFFIHSNFLEDFAREYKKDFSAESSRSFSVVVREFLDRSETVAKTKESFDEKTLSSFYSKSIF